MRVTRTVSVPDRLFFHGNERDIRIALLASARSSGLINAEIVVMNQDVRSRCFIAIVEGELQRKLSRSMNIARRMKSILEEK